MAVILLAVKARGDVCAGFCSHETAVKAHVTTKEKRKERAPYLKRGAASQFPCCFNSELDVALLFVAARLALGRRLSLLSLPHAALCCFVR